MDTGMEMDGAGRTTLGRRTFLAMAAAAGAATFLVANGSQVAAAVAGANKKILWLRGTGCGGCTASFLNGGNPDVLAAVKSISVDLTYQEGLMGLQGIFNDDAPMDSPDHDANSLRKNTISAGGYVLVIEGAIPNGPDGSGRYCMIGGDTLKSILKDAAASADAIVAVGTCAAYGGISAAGRSVTDARGVAFTGSSRFKGILGELGIKRDVINVPGCPMHPDWLLLTLADVVTGADVPTDEYQRPVAFFPSDPVHVSCSRRGYYDVGRRDGNFAEGHCLYGMGCKGPVSYADCPTRRWNGGVNMCTQAGGLCIACAEPGFPDAFSPFFSRLEGRSILPGIDVDPGAKIILGAAVLGAGLHAVKRLAIGESDREEEPGKEKGKRGL
jgi:methanophenazine hydrogenase